MTQRVVSLTRGPVVPVDQVARPSQAWSIGHKTDSRITFFLLNGSVPLSPSNGDRRGHPGSRTLTGFDASTALPPGHRRTNFRFRGWLLV
jgi:hypothetical protein